MSGSEHTPLDRLLRHVVMGPYVRLLSRLRVVGRHHLPRSGAVILVANHQSFSDSLVIPLAVDRPVYFLGKSEYFTGTGPRDRAVATFMRAMGVVPVDRTGGRAAAAAIEAGERVLAAGRVFGVYPEGTRVTDGRLHRGRTGAARLALSTGAPVVPCAIVGTDRLQPHGARLLRPAKVTVVFGPPVAFAPAGQYTHVQRRLRGMTDQMMFALRDLSGREYVEEYAKPAAES